MTNTASVAAPAGFLDPNTANNTASDTDTVIPAADLSVTKTDGVTSVVQGGTVTYTIVAANAGPGAVTGAVVSDTFGAQLTGVTWTCAATAGSGCPGSGSGNLSAAVNLLVGGTATFTATGTVTGTGTLANTAAIAPPAGVTDPGAGNNSATDGDTVIHEVIAADDPPVTVPFAGGTVPTVVANDTVGGAAAVIGGNISAPTLTNTGGLTGLVINADGTLTVPAGVTPGTYTATYQICALAVPTSCDSATVPITVAAPVVDAVNDPLAIIPATGGTVPTVVSNDTVDGAPAVIGGNISAPTLTNNGGPRGPRHQR